ncbi:MAG: hypothetical protein ABIA78_00020 [archaeon]
MDNVKKAFLRVKQDMDFLKNENDSIKQNLVETRGKLIELCEVIEKLNGKINSLSLEYYKEMPKIQINKQCSSSTKDAFFRTLSTGASTHNTYLGGLKGLNMDISTGNEGVSTDRQTDRQTDRHITNETKIRENTIENATAILDSLDSIKKEIRIKFKRLTEQEFLVFSALYQLDEEIGHSDYKVLSDKLNLTESSIRDYIGRIIKKGIPVEKKKINNKNVQLSISSNLKKVVSLPTILQLRGL